MQITIKNFCEEQWQKYREIRLLAIKTDPLSYTSSYEEEVELSEHEWRSRINAMSFALVDEQVVALIGLLKNQPLSVKHCAEIVSLWVKPEMRGRGIGKMLLKSIMENASSNGIKKLIVYATASQEHAIATYESAGFIATGILKKQLFKDGVYLDEVLMEWHAEN